MNRKRPEELIRDEIVKIAGYHVADPAGMVKLDAMENPYPLPRDLRARIAELVASAEVNRYPDAGAARLKARLHEAFSIPESVALTLGNGSDEIIQMLMLATARPGASVIGLEPSFVMYRLIAQFCGMKFIGVPLGDDFTLDGGRLAAAVEAHQPALVFISYPNNPTGNLFDDTEIERVLRASSGLVIVDEAYFAFAGRTWIDRLQAWPNLLVMRTLSKSGLAGLRLGFVAGGVEWLQHLDKVRLPYNVGVLTQLVAEEALRHQPLLDAQAARIRAERSRLFEALAALGTTPYPSDANFILFRTANAGRVYDGLRQRGVLIRNLHGSHPSLDGCLRVTVGTPEENDRFLGALRPALG